jgi:hypothetical protein
VVCEKKVSGKNKKKMIKVKHNLFGVDFAVFSLTRAKCHYTVIDSSIDVKLDFVHCSRLYELVDGDPQVLLQFLEDLRRYVYVINHFSSTIDSLTFWLNPLLGKRVRGMVTPELRVSLMKYDIIECLSTLSKSSFWPVFSFNILNMNSPIHRLLYREPKPYPQGRERDLLAKMIASGEESSELINLPITWSNRFSDMMLPLIVQQFTMDNKVHELLKRLWSAPAATDRFMTLLFNTDKKYLELDGTSSFAEVFNLNFTPISMDEQVDDFLGELYYRLPDDDEEKRQSMMGAILERYSLPTGYPQEIYSASMKMYEVERFPHYDQWLTEMDTPEIKVNESCSPQSLDDCGACVLVDSLMDPQDRCHAVCVSTNRRCRRASLKEGKYCRQHSEMKKRRRMRSTHGHRRGGAMTRDLYDLAPDESPNIRRHHGSGRPINPALRRRTKNYETRVGDLLLPVYRISNLYKESNGWKKNPKHCGRYFFFDADSDTYLHLGRSTRVFGSKIEAYVKMYAELAQKSEQFIRIGYNVIKLVDERALARSFSGVQTVTLAESSNDPHVEKLAGKCKLWNHTALPGLWEIAIRFEPLRSIIYGLPFAVQTRAIEDYFGRAFLDAPDEKEEDGIDSSDLSRLYPTIDNTNGDDVEIGQLDQLDGPICVLGHNLGVDTIILSHEVGGHDAVTEIIDLRDNAYDHLTHELQVFDDENDEDGNRIYPKIWSLFGDGIVSVIDNDVGGESLGEVVRGWNINNNGELIMVLD